MPFITIKTLAGNQEIDLKKMAERISAEMDVELSRLTILVQRFQPNDYFRGDEYHVPIIDISALSKHNLTWIQKFMHSVARAAADQLQMEENDLVVYSHLIENGCFLSRGSCN